MSTLTQEHGSRIGFRYRAYIRQEDSNKRISIWLGNIPERDAQAFRLHANAIIDANTQGFPIPRATRSWIDRLDRVTRSKLQPIIAVERSVEEWIDTFLKTTAQNVVSSTIDTRSDSLDLFARSFATRRIRGVSAEDLLDWLDEIGNTRAKSTTAKIAGHVKLFFAWLVENRAIDYSPAGKLPTVMKVGEKHFITREVVQRILHHVFDPELRALILLARYGGIRVPSEIRELKIGDINIDAKRILVRDVKRKTERLIPLFPELSDLPVASRDLDELLLPTMATMPGATIDSRLRSALAAADVDPWPRLWHSLRATRETELVERFGIKAASIWIGNSEAVAVKNYLLVPEHLYDAAASGT